MPTFLPAPTGPAEPIHVLAESSPHPGCSRRFAGRVLAWFIPLLLTVAVAQAADLVGGPADDGRWITLGADAFEVLQEQQDLSFAHAPLQEIEQSHGVVVTRVAAGDLEKISRLMHDAFNRCSGFLVHPSLEDAQSALATSHEAQLLGSPITYLVDRPIYTNALQLQVDETQIQTTIQTLSTQFNNRFYQHPSGVAASGWIRDLWLGFVGSRSDVTVELYNHPAWPQPSVVMTIPGTWRPDQVVVLGGHMDSIVSGGTGNPDFIAPGADDNASGIAALSEAARVLLANNFRPQRTVKFMAYAAEEVGLLGSQEIAAEHQSEGIEVVAVLQLDMTGFNGSSEDIGLLTDFVNPTLSSFVGELIETYQPNLLWTSTACGYACSDHAAWHNRGFPAAMPFEARVGQHNSSIHSTADTYETLGANAVHVAKFSRLATAFAVEIGLDNLGEMFRDGFESGNTVAWSASANLKNR